MYYNLELFGKKVHSMRNALGLTQKDVKHDNYKKAIDKAMTIYEITGQIKMKEMMMNVCTKYNIEL